MFLATIEDLRKYVIVSSQFTLANITVLKPDVLTAYFKKWIPESMITTIESYKTETLGSVKNNSFLLFENALAKLCIYDFLVHGQFNIGDGGTTRMETDKMKSAFKNQIKDSKELLLERALDVLEELFILFDANTAIFTQWEASTIKVKSKKLLLQTATEFDSIESLYRKNSTFYSLVSSQETCIDLYLRSRFGKTLVDEIIANDSLSAEKKIFREYLQKALANYTVMKSITDKIVIITSDGLRVIQHDKDTASQLETTPSENSISTLIGSREDTAKRYINLADVYMNENKAAFGITEDKIPFQKTRGWM